MYLLFYIVGDETVLLIENDLNILSRTMISRLDQVQQQQVISLLKDLGIKPMTPSDLIHNHIIPTFKTGKWKVIFVRNMKVVPGYSLLICSLCP